MFGFFRRKYLINKEFQIPFIFRMVGIAAVVSVLLYVSNFIIFWRFNVLGQQMNLDESHPFYIFLKEQVSIMNTAYIFICMGVFFFLVISGLFISHRISGPLYNLKMNIRKFSQLNGLQGISEIKDVRFRKNDFFHDLCEELNLHIANLKTEYQRLSVIEKDLLSRGVESGINYQENDQNILAVVETKEVA